MGRLIKFGCIGVVVLVILIGVVLAAAPKSGTATITGPSTNASTSNQPPATAAKLGETIEKDGYSLAGMTVKDPAPPGTLYKAEPGKKLVAVEIVVGNVSGKALSINPLNVTLVDDGGFSYKPELASTQDKQLELVDLNPGEKARGWAGFKLPSSAIAKSVKYQTNIFGGTTLQAGLGQ